MDDANKELWRVACQVAGMAPNSGMVVVHSRTVLAVQAERERCMRALEALHWMPRVPGRWDETDVAHAEGFNKAKAEALAALGPNVGVEPPYSVGSNDGLGVLGDEGR